MFKNLIKMEYYNPYYFCNIISEIIMKPNMDMDRTLNDFFEPFLISFTENSTNGFQKQSFFYDFIYWVIDRVLWEQHNKYFYNLDYNLFDNDYYKKQLLSIEMLLNEYNADYTYFSEWYFNNNNKTINWDNPEDAFSFQYLEHLEDDNCYSKIIDRLAKEVFHILFQDRNLLLGFNLNLAGYLMFDEHKSTRVHIPKWVKRAIYYRDAGLCVYCNTDLSGTLRVIENMEMHYDHIVSLNEGGINDISNIQLLCQECNLKKSDSTGTSNSYHSWVGDSE